MVFFFLLICLFNHEFSCITCRDRPRCHHSLASLVRQAMCFTSYTPGFGDGSVELRWGALGIMALGGPEQVNLCWAQRFSVAVNLHNSRGTCSRKERYSANGAVFAGPLHKLFKRRCDHAELCDEKQVVLQCSCGGKRPNQAPCC